MYRYSNMILAFIQVVKQKEGYFPDLYDVLLLLYCMCVCMIRL